MTTEVVSFGAYLRRLRLEAGFGLRTFADLSGMQPSNLSRIESGRLAPPQDAAIIRRLAKALGLGEDSAEYVELNNLASQARPGTMPPDLAEYAGTKRGIPLLLRTVKGKNLDEAEFRKLAEYIDRELGKRSDP